MSDFLQDMLKVSGNDLASRVKDGIESDVSGFMDTGSYAFNALLTFVR